MPVHVRIPDAVIAKGSSAIGRYVLGVVADRQEKDSQKSDQVAQREIARQERKLTVVRLWRGGKRVAEIARIVGYSEYTVRDDIIRFLIRVVGLDVLTAFAVYEAGGLPDEDIPPGSIEPKTE